MNRLIAESAIAGNATMQAAAIISIEIAARPRRVRWSFMLYNSLFKVLRRYPSSPLGSRDIHMQYF
jgi:hypothetical protein